MLSWAGLPRFPQLYFCAALHCPAVFTSFHQCLLHAQASHPRVFQDVANRHDPAQSELLRELDEQVRRTNEVRARLQAHRDGFKKSPVDAPPPSRPPTT